MYERVFKGIMLVVALTSVTAAVLIVATAFATRDEALTPAALGSGPKPTVSKPAGKPIPLDPSLDAYRGLGSWVDLYDTRAWKDPAATVRDMAKHGVRTLYVETANFNAPSAIYKPAAQREFITEAHAHHMRVVAWYLPSIKPGSVDMSRIREAIEFETADGQRFDSFALDIEATEVHSVSARNRDLEALSKEIRSMVGPKYELGAIIPSPVGLKRKHGFWDHFPYTMLPKYYDVILPMGYYSFHTSSASGAYSDARGNVRIIRSQPGCSTIPIHLIGGIAENSNGREVRAFVRGVNDDKLIGASLYGWPGTSAEEWKALSAVGK